MTCTDLFWLFWCFVTGSGDWQGFVERETQLWQESLQGYFKLSSRLPVLLVTYEQLHKDTHAYVREILNFLGVASELSMPSNVSWKSSERWVKNMILFDSQQRSRIRLVLQTMASQLSRSQRYTDSILVMSYTSPH